MYFRFPDGKIQESDILKLHFNSVHFSEIAAEKSSDKILNVQKGNINSLIVLILKLCQICKIILPTEMQLWPEPDKKWF